MGEDRDVLKPKLYTGKPLSGTWQLTRKIDGVRALRSENGYVSRAGKPLHNLQLITGDDLEIYAGSWEETITRVRSHGGEPVPQEMAYSLDPLDTRLFLGYLNDPSPEHIAGLLRKAIARGDEGLVLRQGDKWLKVKDHETFDVVVTAIVPGRGKHTGRMGALMTERGKVGTGFTDAQREALGDCVGQVIEVECMSLTPAGKFRHPRFVRLREDRAA
jgi:hypothetical protein